MHVRSALTAILTTILMSFPALAARDVSTAELAEFCDIHVGIADSSPHEASGAELFSSGMCLGYLKGHRDGVDGQKEFDVGGLVYCIPPEATNGQLAQLYAEWANSNPELADHSAAIGFARVMAASFPCQP